MTQAVTIIRRLEAGGRLDGSGYRALLDPDLAPAAVELLHSTARRVAVDAFGSGIKLRGLIEVSNVCRNNCLYCGIRAANGSLTRYALTDVQICDCAASAYRAGLRTVVLQGGESGPNGPFNADRVVRLVTKLKQQLPDMTVTLSLGEWERRDLERFRQAGADRYLLRHESINPDHYALLHPADMCLRHRVQCLYDLKDLGFATGCGMMVGSPGQTLDHLVQDLQFIERLQPEMVGIGPFLPHSATPFGNEPAGSLDLTLRLLSIMRLMLPQANLPATTALATLSPDGRLRGILCGANVVMPNVSPPDIRSCYTLYDGKACTRAEAVEGLSLLQAELDTIGYHCLFPS